MVSAPGFGFNNVYQELTPENVLENVSEVMLWRHYLGTEFQLRKSMCSPLRRDKNPSFSLYEDSSGRIKFKDFGGDRGDIFDFLCAKESITFPEALIMVNIDFTLRLGTVSQQAGKGLRMVSKQAERQLGRFEEEFTVKNPSSSFVQAFVRSYREEDYGFWMGFGIREETLRRYNVYCASKVKVNGVVMYQDSHGDPCYIYHFPRTKHNKCYFPFRTGSRRFVGSTNNYEDIQGYDQCELKKGNKKLLILTKSMKDVMVLRELGYDAMAIHGEGQYFYRDFVRHIKKYYPRIISLYDRDRTGVKGARHIWREYGIQPYFVSKTWTRLHNVKDISDVYKKIGRRAAEEFIEGITGL